MESDAGKLFVGGIAWDTNEERLREYFEKFGEVVEAVIMRDRATGRARGFGFIVFADPAVAERVVLEKHKIDGRMVEAKKAVPRDDQHSLAKNSAAGAGTGAAAITGTGAAGGALGLGSRTKKIFVGGLASSVTDADFRGYFEQFGTITDVVVMYDHNTQRPRGFGFITYDTEDAVDKALFKTFHELNGKMVEVKRAVPKELSPGPSIRSPVSGLRVNSILNGYTSGFGPSSIGGGYGMMRMDTRFGPLSGGGRNGGYPSFSPATAFDSALNPTIGGGLSLSSGLQYATGRQQLSPYYSGNSNRYSSNIGYGNVNYNHAGSTLNTLSRNLWGGSGLNYNTGSAGSSSFLSSGSGGLGGFGNTGVNWGSNGMPPQEAGGASGSGGGGSSGYAGGNLGYGLGENGLGLGSGGVYGRNVLNGNANSSFNGVPSNNGFERSFGGSSGGGLIYGDSTWMASGTSELDDNGPFRYRMNNVTSEMAAAAGAKGSTAGYIGR